MPKKQFSFFLFLIFFAAFSLFGQSDQSFPKGAIFDEEVYSTLPRRAALATRSYEGLPRFFSLKRFAPLPGDQANYGTCVAWASAYAARTITESIALNRINQTETTQNVFSPVFIYRSIRPDDPRGLRGAQIYQALDLMRDSGAVKMLEIEHSMELPGIDLSFYEKSRKYPIADYVTLFSKEDRYKPALVTRIVKKSLTEGKPVIIGMNTPNSFLDAKDVWVPEENETPDKFFGGHAMCVVGYDDEKAAFEVLNSWGRKWGNGGYIWIPYNVFVDFVMESYEIIENLAVFNDVISFEGFSRIEIIDSGNETKSVPLILSEGNIYRSADSYSEGTRFRFVIGARESAYVYSFKVTQPSRDNNFYSPVLLFPQTGISPLLTYRDSTVNLPGEEKTFSVDDEAGTEFLITLYSKQALDIHGIMNRFMSFKGAVNERLAYSIGEIFLNLIDFSEEEALFTAEPDDPNAVAALVLAMESR